MLMPLPPLRSMSLALLLALLLLPLRVSNSPVLAELERLPRLPLLLSSARCRMHSSDSRIRCACTSSGLLLESKTPPSCSIFASRRAARCRPVSAGSMAGGAAAAPAAAAAVAVVVVAFVVVVVAVLVAVVVLAVAVPVAVGGVAIGSLAASSVAVVPITAAASSLILRSWELRPRFHAMITAGQRCRPPK